VLLQHGAAGARSSRNDVVAVREAELRHVGEQLVELLRQPALALDDQHPLAVDVV
jgi:hypothetical protein